MISGSKFRLLINTIFNIRSSSFVSALSVVAAVSIVPHNHPKKKEHKVSATIETLNQTHHYLKSTKSIYGSSCVNDCAPYLCNSSRFSGGFNTTPVFNLHTNIIMLVEMLATGLPFVGWRKPDPGD